MAMALATWRRPGCGVNDDAAGGLVRPGTFDARAEVPVRCPLRKRRRRPAQETPSRTTPTPQQNQPEPEAEEQPVRRTRGKRKDVWLFTRNSRARRSSGNDEEWAAVSIPEFETSEGCQDLHVWLDFTETQWQLMGWWHLVPHSQEDRRTRAEDALPCSKARRWGSRQSSDCPGKRRHHRNRTLLGIGLEDGVTS